MPVCSNGGQEGAEARVTHGLDRALSPEAFCSSDACVAFDAQRRNASPKDLRLRHSATQPLPVRLLRRILDADAARAPSPAYDPVRTNLTADSPSNG